MAATEAVLWTKVRSWAGEAEGAEIQPCSRAKLQPQETLPQLRAKGIFFQLGCPDGALLSSPPEYPNANRMLVAGGLQDRGGVRIGQAGKQPGPDAQDWSSC